MSKLIDLYKTRAYQLAYSVLANFQKKYLPNSDTVRSYLDEIERNGYIVIPKFYSVRECSDLISEVDRLNIEYRADVLIDPNESDHRIHGAERLSPLIRKFHEHKLLNDIAAGYYQTEFENYFTLAGKLVYKDNNLGSGGGWHRDTVHQRQFKAMVYLSDVTQENGPFQLIQGTQNAKSVLETIKSADIKFDQNRLTQEDVNKVLKLPKYSLKTFTGAAGTLILFISTSIHRGMEIRSGIRYALTNYYYSKQNLNRETIKKIEPLLPKSY